MLSFSDQRFDSLWQINVEATAETDDTVAVSSGHGLPFIEVRFDAPRDQSGNLNNGNINLAAIRSLGRI